MKKKKAPYPKSFAKRLTWRIMLTLLVVMGFTSIAITMTSESVSKLFCTEICTDILKSKHGKVRRILSDVYVASVNRVPEIENSLDQPDKLYGIMKNMVEMNPRIRSCGVSFIESYYPSKGRWFCPYAVRDTSQQVITRTLGDAQHDYLKADWFVEACASNKGYWSKPFFEQNDSTRPLSSYLLPIHNRQGDVVAILGVDLSLDWLSDKLDDSDIILELFNLSADNDDDENEDDDEDEDENEDENENEEAASEDTEQKSFFGVYFFIIDIDGNYIAHPEKKKILHENYFTYTKETKDTLDDIGARRMVTGGSGHFMDNSQLFNYTIFYRPVKHVNWSMAMAVPNIYINLIGYMVVAILLLLIIIALLVTFFVGRKVIRSAVNPIKVLAASANEVAQGNFDAPLPQVKSRDEICQLRDSFEHMQHSLKQYIEELKTTTAQKSAIENELKIAHDIQMSMLPKSFPERSDVDIYGMLTPAKGVGGDLFDFFIRDDKVFFCIGDVSGKGIPAALVMSVTRSLFRNISSYVSSPEVIVNALNNALATNNETNMFVTLFVGVLDLPTGLLHYCNGGHNSPLLVGRDVGLLPCDPNLAVGVLPDFTFSLQEAVIDSKTTIFLFTDGLNEAENASHAQFGDDRIVEVANHLLAEKQHQPVNIIYEMNEAVHHFVNHAEQSDDLTMLAIQYTK